MEKATLEFLQANTLAQFKKVETDFPNIVLPDGVSVKSLENLQKYKNIFSGKFHTNSVKDYSAYVKNQQTNISFIDADQMKSISIFDLGTVEQPEHCNHKAVLIMKRTAEYNAIRVACSQESHMSGNRFTQRDLIEWIQDWDECISFIDVFGDKIEKPEGRKAIQAMTVEATAKLESVSAQFSEGRTAMEKIEAKGSDNKLPSRIQFKFKPYKEFSDVTFSLRLMVIPSDKSIIFKMSVVGLDRHLEKFLEEFLDLLKKELAGTEIYVGEFV